MFYISIAPMLCQGFAARYLEKAEDLFTVHGLSVLDKNYKAPHIIKLILKFILNFF